MRAAMWAASFLGLALATPAWAQFGGADPTNLQYKIVGADGTLQSPGLTNMSLSSLFSSHPLSPGSKVLGTSKFPTPEQMPGQSWLDAFHIKRTGQVWSRNTLIGPRWLGFGSK